MEDDLTVSLKRPCGADTAHCAVAMESRDRSPGDVAHASTSATTEACD